MTFEGFLRLAVQSVTNPREVAALLLSIRPSKEALWTAFLLVIVLNALVFSASIMLTPMTGMIPAVLANPVSFLVMQGATLAASIVAFTYVGRWMSGKARLEEVALLLIWLQGLRVLLQAILTVVMIGAPILGGLISMVGTALGVWILVNFLDEAHELGSLLRALAVLILGVLAMAFAMSMLLTLLGVSPQGMTDYV